MHLYEKDVAKMLQFYNNTVTKKQSEKIRKR